MIWLAVEWRDVAEWRAPSQRFARFVFASGIPIQNGKRQPGIELPEMYNKLDGPVEELPDEVCSLSLGFA